ncbi:MAG: pitrilysin family protein [Vicinamibacterales bacterium]
MVDRSRLPALGPEPAFTFPQIERRVLSNGLRVWTAEHRDVPVVSALLLLPAGAADDPADRPGLAAITGDLLDEGCGDLGALEFHEALGRMGTSLDTEVGSDATLLGFTLLERFADRALPLLADLAIRPRLEAREFDRVRELRLNRLMQLRDVPSAVAERVFVQRLYGQHPYGHLAIGTEASLSALTVEEVRAFHDTRYDPSFATLLLVGDGTHDRLASLAEQAFGHWRAAPHRLRADRSTPAPPPPADRLVMVHRPGAAQSEIRIGHVSVTRSTPDYHALITLNMILGGQFVSRINMNLREQKGYTYGARTSFDVRRGFGPFVLQAGVQLETTTDAVKEAIGELEAIRGERPVTREELLLGRAALTRGYPRNFETGEQIARGAAQLALYDLPDDYFSSFVPTVLSLTEADITRAAATYIHPEQLLTVIVGDRDKVGPTLDTLGTPVLHVT